MRANARARAPYASKQTSRSRNSLSDSLHQQSHRHSRSSLHCISSQPIHNARSRSVHVHSAQFGRTTQNRRQTSASSIGSPIVQTRRSLSVGTKDARTDKSLCTTPKTHVADLTGKVAIITGGSRGIGYATTQHLLDRGCSVVFCSQNNDSVQNAQQKLAQQYPELTASTSEASNTATQRPQFIKGIACDVTDEASIQQVMKLVKDLNNGQGASLLVNAAGVCEERLLLRSSKDMMQTILNTNVLGTMLVTKQFLKQLPPSPASVPPPLVLSVPTPSSQVVNDNESKTDSPHSHRAQEIASILANPHYHRVICFSSVVAKQGQSGLSAYGASKAAIDGFVKSMSREMPSFRGAPITFNAVAPGYVLTDMTTTLTDDMYNKIVSRTALNRVASPHEIAQFIGFLCSPQSSYINGQSLNIDGGM